RRLVHESDISQRESRNQRPQSGIHEKGDEMLTWAGWTEFESPPHSPRLHEAPPTKVTKPRRIAGFHIPFFRMKADSGCLLRCQLGTTSCQPERRTHSRLLSPWLGPD